MRLNAVETETENRIIFFNDQKHTKRNFKKPFNQ